MQSILSCAKYTILCKVYYPGTAGACCKRSEDGDGRPKLRTGRQNTLNGPRVGLYGYKKKQGLYVQSLVKHATSCHNGHTLIRGQFHVSFTYCFPKANAFFNLCNSCYVTVVCCIIYCGMLHYILWYVALYTVVCYIIYCGMLHYILWYVALYTVVSLYTVVCCIIYCSMLHYIL